MRHGQTVPQIDVVAPPGTAVEVEKRDNALASQEVMVRLLRAAPRSCVFLSVIGREGRVVRIDPMFDLFDPQGMPFPVAVPAKRAAERGEADTADGEALSQPDHALVRERRRSVGFFTGVRAPADLLLLT